MPLQAAMEALTNPPADGEVDDKSSKRSTRPPHEGHHADRRGGYSMEHPLAVPRLGVRALGCFRVQAKSSTLIEEASHHPAQSLRCSRPTAADGLTARGKIHTFLTCCNRPS